MPRTIPSPNLIILLVAGIFLTSCGSGRDQTPAASEPTAAQSSPSPKPAPGFETDLDFVRKGQFTYVWVFSRKDGKPLTKEDGDFLKQNAPQVVDWAKSEGSNKVVAGTNFDLAKGNLELLKKRFIAEDYSVR